MPRAEPTNPAEERPQPAAVRACVVIPTYDHGGTVADVVRRAAALLPVFVVDDGSTDDTALRLAGAPATLLRHPRNRGKGAALQTGLAAAFEAGFTHAVSLDADGQHRPEDLPPLLEAARREPHALVLGTRDLRAAGAGRGSRFGNAVSCFWTWVETGFRLSDTQTGFRVYPLALVDSLWFRTTGYDFEVEVIVVAAWCGAPLRAVPVTVHYPPRGERISHLRPVVDFLRISRLNTVLVTQRICLPAPYLAVRRRKTFRALPFGQRLRESLREGLLRDADTPARIGAAVGLGVFVGLTPFWGAQVLLTLLGAHVLGLPKALAVAAAHISFPVLVPAILYGSLVLGRVLLGRDPGSGGVATLRLEGADFVPWVVGSFALATAAAAVLGPAAWLLARGWRRLRRAGGAP